MKLKDKVSVITGSSRGIGKEVALTFVDEGCSVVITSRHLNEAEEVAKEITDRGGRAIAVETDVSESSSISAMMKKAVSTFGRIDILVNNAGMSMTVPSIDLKLEDWNKALATNLTSHMLCSQEAARVMIKQGGGKIVNISSMLADTIIPERIGYLVPKAALNHLTKALAIEWAQYKINVNAIGPAYVLTELIQDLIDRKLLDEEKLKSRSPFKRFVTTKEVAKAVLFFASSDSDAITGEYLKIDCGWSKYGGYELF